jgi:hypothetical protein
MSLLGSSLITGGLEHRGDPREDSRVLKLLLRGLGGKRPVAGIGRHKVHTMHRIDAKFDVETAASGVRGHPPDDEFASVDEEDPSSSSPLRCVGVSNMGPKRRRTVPGRGWGPVLDRSLKIACCVYREGATITAMAGGKVNHGHHIQVKIE